MYLLLREDGVLRVHQLIHEYSKRVCIKGISLHPRIPLELRMVEIRHISLLPQLVDEIFIHRGRLTNFGDAIFDVDVSDVQHAETFDGGVLDMFQRLE